MIRIKTMKFSEKLKACRKGAGLTQSQVAEQLHVSRKTVSGWENEHSFPDVTSLVQLSDIYGVPVDDLLRDNRLLGHYEEEDQELKKSHKFLKFAYVINIIFLILGYLDFFRAFGFHFFLIPLVLLGNGLLFISHFSSWHIFQDIKIRVKIALSFFALLILNVILNVVDVSIWNEFNKVDIYYLSGVVLGRLILILVLTLGLILLPVVLVN